MGAHQRLARLIVRKRAGPRVWTKVLLHELAGSPGSGGLGTGSGGLGTGPECSPAR
jgi:hypothetical protein